jgi:hypothetical protein
MSTDAQPAPEEQGDTKVSQDLLLDLNFVPEWARTSSEKNPYADHRGTRAEDRDRRQQGGGRRGGDRGKRDRAPGGKGGGRDGRPQQRGRDRDRNRDRDRRPKREPVAPPIPVEIAFLPDRNKLSAMAKEIHRTRKAYPIMELASLFIGKPDHHLLKIQLRSDQESRGELSLFQFKPNGLISTDRSQLIQHLVSHHLNDFYDVEIEEGDAPAGNFVCVGRCRLSGEILGPPNYHGFQARIQKMVSTKFSNMTADAYRAKVEIVHDPELVEQWKNENRLHKRFRIKEKNPAVDETDGEEKEDTREVLTEEQASRHFQEQMIPGLIQTCRKAIVPAKAALNIPDPGLKREIRDAWQRESRFPLSLNFAMRPAFRHMRMHIFKVNRKDAFVTAVHPRPLDPGAAVETIRAEMTFLRDHPGCTRQEMVDGLQPGSDPNSAEVTEVLNNLRWLIDRGHVIEFYNGRLAVPTAARASVPGGDRGRRKRRPRRKPAQKPADASEAGQKG